MFAPGMSVDDVEAGTGWFPCTCIQWLSGSEAARYSSKFPSVESSLSSVQQPSRGNLEQESVSRWVGMLAVLGVTMRDLVLCLLLR